MSDEEVICVPALRLSSNPKDYNRVRCEVCMGAVKVHHLKNHLQTCHNLSMLDYRQKHGAELQHLSPQTYHKCGLCDETFLFDLDTLYSHVSRTHQVKVKEYVDTYLSFEANSENLEPALDHDGAPILNIGQTKGNNGDQMKISQSSDSTDFDQNNTTEIISDNSRLNSPVAKKFKTNILDCNSQHIIGQLDDEILPNCYNTNYIKKIRDITVDGDLISNDLADYTEVACNLCGLNLPMTRLRSHTKSVHKVTITEYKANYGPDLIPVQTVYHRCGICEELVILDSDHIAVHLKRPGHNITHKNYNEGYMVDTRGKGRSTNVSINNCYSKDDPATHSTSLANISALHPRLNITFSRDKRTIKPVGVYDESDYDVLFKHQSSVEEDEIDEEPEVIIEQVNRKSKNNSHNYLNIDSSNQSLDVIWLDDNQDHQKERHLCDDDIIEIIPGSSSNEVDSDIEEVFVETPKGNLSFQIDTNDNVDLVDTVDIGVFVDIST